jgi:hypothetical protein
MPSRPCSAALAALVAAAFHSSGARADTPTFSFSGYGTLGLVHSSDDRADYLVDPFKPTGPGYTRAWSADVDSRVGAQVTANIAPRFSAVVQVIAQQRYDDTYKPELEWANVKFEVTPDLSVRGGRVVLPIFMVTDSRRVGFANPWVRPPVEVYGLVPLTTSDGADATWRLPWGDVNNTLQLTVGRANPKFPSQPTIGTGTAQVRGITAIADTIEFGPTTARLSYGRARLTISAFDPLFDAFRQFGPPGEDIATRYEVDDRKVDFVGVGVVHDPGRWFVMAEWAKFDTHSIIGARSAWYASGGYRFGNVTPYVTYAASRAVSSTSDPGLNPAFFPPTVVPVVATLNATLNTSLAALGVQKSASIGVRWDVMRNLAAKLQYDHVKRGAGSPGTFGNIQPGFEPGGKAGIFSVAVDFVF